MAYEDKVYFYVKQVKPFKHEEIIGMHVIVAKENRDHIKKNGKEKYLEHMRKNYPKERIIKDYNKGLDSYPHSQEWMYLKDEEIGVAEPVMVYKKTKWIKGAYYAHEYDMDVAGRARQVMYTNGYSEYEIQCLDKKLDVADGVWEELERNGMGDEFEPHERLKEIVFPGVAEKLKEGLKKK